MSYLRKFSVKAKLFVLVGIFAVGLVAFAAFSYRTLHVVKVNGPYYQRIVQGKDLIADIKPPPESIIEAYLVVLQMADETERVKLEELAEKGKVLRTDYERQHEFWAKDLPEGKLKETLVVKSYRPAMEFFAIRDREFTPLVLRGGEGREVVRVC